MQRGDRSAQFMDDSANGLVLAFERLGRVSRREFGAILALLEDVSRDLRVEIAHGSDFFYGHPFGDKLLLHCDDFAGIGLPDNFAQLLPDLLGRMALMQVPDNVLEVADAVSLIADSFAHS
jgi:hypothetical protein